MKIGDNNLFIELIEVERVPEHLPTSGDVKVKVTVQIQEFRGTYENVWLGSIELRIFLKELIKLNEKRKGKVKLNALSPEDFWFEIYSIDNVGGFEVQVQLKRHFYSGSANCPTLLSGGFFLDPSQFDSIIKGFSALTEHGS